MAATYYLRDFSFARRAMPAFIWLCHREKVHTLNDLALRLGRHDNRNVVHVLYDVFSGELGLTEEIAFFAFKPVKSVLAEALTVDVNIFDPAFREHYSAVLAEPPLPLNNADDIEQKSCGQTNPDSPENIVGNPRLDDQPASEDVPATIVCAADKSEEAAPARGPVLEKGAPIHLPTNAVAGEIFEAVQRRFPAIAAAFSELEITNLAGLWKRFAAYPVLGDNWSSYKNLLRILAQVEMPFKLENGDWLPITKALALVLRGKPDPVLLLPEWAEERENLVSERGPREKFGKLLLEYSHRNDGKYQGRASDLRSLSRGIDQRGRNGDLRFLHSLKREEYQKLAAGSIPAFDADGNIVAGAIELLNLFEVPFSRVLEAFPFLEKRLTEDEYNSTMPGPTRQLGRPLIRPPADDRQP